MPPSSSSGNHPPQQTPSLYDNPLVNVSYMTYTDPIMTKLARKRLSVLLCLFLTTFLFCQGAAKAAGLLPVPPQSVMPAEMMSCHDMNMSEQKPSPQSDCHNQCQHLDKAYSGEYQPSVWDSTPLTVLYLIPLLHSDIGSPISLVTLPWHDPPGDPPIPIRLQRFLI